MLKISNYSVDVSKQWVIWDCHTDMIFGLWLNIRYVPWYNFFQTSVLVGILVARHVEMTRTRMCRIVLTTTPVRKWRNIFTARWLLRCWNIFHWCSTSCAGTFFRHNSFEKHGAQGKSWATPVEMGVAANGETARNGSYDSGGASKVKLTPTPPVLPPAPNQVVPDAF